MMEAKFEKVFLKAVKKHSGIRKQIEQKVLQIIEHPVELGEPLKGNLRGFYSCPVKRNFIIIYLYCEICRKKGDDEYVACEDCATTPNETISFLIVGPHDEASGPLHIIPASHLHGLWLRKDYSEPSHVRVFAYNQTSPKDGQ